MKQSFTVIALVVMGSLKPGTGYCQQPMIGCIDKEIRQKAEEVKQGFMKQGMSVYKDAMITMQSRVPAPVLVELNKDSTYQLLYFGSKDAKGLKMDIYDENDKLLESLSVKRNSEDYITYSITPDHTDLYAIVLTQTWKEKSMCGSFTILAQRKEKEHSETH